MTSNEAINLTSPLADDDPEVCDLIKQEKRRQFIGLEMIASENFTSRAVNECLSSCLTNKYSEGTVGQRYYGGNEYIDQIESLCQTRALSAFSLDPCQWGVNVQPYSGSPANFAVYTALVGPHGRIMGLDLPDGGHLTHGFYTATKKVSATSIFFESMPYKVDPNTGLIDYDKLEENAKLFKPKMIVAGISCYPRLLDYARFRQICDCIGALLLADMSHVAGLVAGGAAGSPFPYCDVVTSTTHKTLRGPRSGLIFYRKGIKHIESGVEVPFDYESKINQAVFPGLQGGPHNHQIAGVAVAMRQAGLPAFGAYQRQVVANARKLAVTLSTLGYKVVTGGTDTHLVWLDLRPTGISGGKGERVLEAIGVSVNKNTVPGDKSALNPGGLRIGSPALTSRGMGEEQMEQIGELMHEAFQLAKEVQVKSGPKLIQFNKILMSPEFEEKVQLLRSRVEQLAQKYQLPGLPDL